MNLDKMYNDRTADSKTFMRTIPETEHTYECLHPSVDRKAPSNRSTEAKKSCERESLYRKISLVFVSLWLVTLTTLLVGLVLYYGRISAIQRELEVLKNSSSILTEGTPKVAFTASLTDRIKSQIRVGPYSEYQLVIYPFVTTNIGGAYNSSKGIFTVPIRGVYYFSISAFGWNNNTSSAVSLCLNDKVYLSVFDRGLGLGRGSTNTITLQLEIGDIIYVRLWANTQLFDGKNSFNNFNGHLLFPI